MTAYTELTSESRPGRFDVLNVKATDPCPLTGHGLMNQANPRYFTAIGLIGEPTAPVIGSAGATNRNS